ncbi:M3 family metallopeptidase [Paludibacter jiangxiensis]|uniref:Peptidyl-dipeptidase Dcp n=1 Tax=Paludibacter jiangxiensis TaxID=681398 RepID=A0A171AK31_9BACT|nr:M3 family metallopeptidase [Paludibacter jiangxiensis]GAT63866.1 peptidyl-dipeptidase Dcp [Paludibacter jiangxiensis]
MTEKSTLSSYNSISNNPFLHPFDTPHAAIPFNEIKLEHYLPSFQEAIRIHESEIDAIVGNKDVPTFQNTIEALENSGRLLSLVTNTFFNLNSAETTDEMQQLAEEISPMLTDHSNNISLNAQLFERVKQVFIQKDYLELVAEQQTLLQKTYDSFADNGANLNDTDKITYRNLTEKLDTASLTFDRNILKEVNDYSLIISDKQRLTGLSDDYLEAAAAKASAKGQNGWLLDLTAPSYVPAMKFLDNRELRQQLYMAFCTKGIHNDANDNQEIIRSIVNNRLQLAQLLGHKTYAEYVLKDRMAETSDNVYKLLNELLTAYKPVADKEIEAVQKYAASLGFTEQLKPWDWAYYAEKLKDQTFTFNEDSLRPYFELNNVITGVFGLATKLYGITFKENTNIPVYHPEVKTFEVFDQDGQYLALLYTDFFPRQGKRPGAWMTEFKGQWKDGEDNHRPHISLVMNFTRPTKTKPALLSFDEVKTFLHEFGHALHGIFSNTIYLSLSGTSVYRDFVECPSQFMENYAVEKEFLDDFAFQYQTKELIPFEMIQKIKNAENYNIGYQCIRQLNFGFIDMAWHMLEKDFSTNVIEFEKQAEKQTQLLPSLENTCISSAFGHIFSGGYAAGYYSYKWAEVLAADSFAAFQNAGIFNQDVANSFRNNILSNGGSEKPMTLYKRFRGQDPSINALLIANGITLHTTK